MTAAWTSDDLKAIAAADEIEMAPRRPDGTLGRFTTIWIVGVGDDVYVRSYRGPSGSWYRAGLGRAAAQALLGDGHEVVLHARTSARSAAVDDLAHRGAQVVLGDLDSGEQTREVADQVNAIGGIDAVIHNSAIYVDDRRIATP